MAEYIERIKALQAINEFYHDPKIDIVIRNIPKVDVVEVKHGYYERVTQDTDRCSICHCSPIADINNIWAFTNYCHNCVAKMQPTDFCSYGERKDK